jgi:hypothetical protein
MSSRTTASFPLSTAQCKAGPRKVGSPTLDHSDNSCQGQASNQVRCDSAHKNQAQTSNLARYRDISKNASTGFCR